MQLGFQKINVRFFIFDEGHYNKHDNTYGDIVEVNEDDFTAASGAIEYQRHSVHANGVRQICLTKMGDF